MAAISPVYPSPVERLSYSKAEEIQLPQWTVAQAKNFLLSYPLPPTGSYFLYRIHDHPAGALACSQLMMSSSGTPVVKLEYIEIDSRDNRWAKLRRDGSFMQPHWNDLNAIIAFHGPLYISSEISQKQMDRRSELLSVGMSAIEADILKAMQSLNKADPGVYFIPYNPGIQTAQFTIFLQGGDLLQRWIPISVTSKGDWLIWQNRVPLVQFANFSDMARFLGLRCTLNQWERMVEMRKTEILRSSSLPVVEMVKPTPVRPVSDETLQAIKGFEVVAPDMKWDDVFSYDRDFFQDAVRDGSLPCS